MELRPGEHASGFYSKHGDVEQYMIDRFGEEFAAYRRRWAMLGGRETLPAEDLSSPVHLLLEIIDACDMKCATCYRARMKNRGSGKRISLDKFRAIADEAEAMGFLSISLADGEPMLHPEIVGILEDLSKRSFRELIMYSNGPLFTAEKREAVLKCAERMRVRMHITMDAITPETYRDLRGGSYIRAMENIDAFLEERKALGDREPLLWLPFLIRERNQDEITPFFEYWKEKADILEFQNLKPTQYPAEPLLDTRVTASFCSWPFRYMSVKADGRILPCCGLGNGHHVFGQYPETSLRKAWSGEPAKGLRDAMRRGALPTACRTCLALDAS